MKQRPPSFRFSPRRSTIPYWVLVVGLLTTAASAFYSERSARARDQIRFDNLVQQVATSITSRVDTYVALLRAGAGLFAGSSQVTPEEFGQFVARLDLRSRYPGMQGIGFAMRVPAQQLPNVVDMLRSAGRPGFRVWPDYPREDYFPIVYLEPQDRRNRAAIGYDMFTEPVRHAAMETAARTGTAAATGKVTLVQEIDPLKQPGFLIYAPVYVNGRSGDHDLDRQLGGFIYSPFRAGDFLSAVVATDHAPLVDIAVYDGRSPDGHALLFDSGATNGSPARTGRFRSTASIDVAGRPWLVLVNSLPAFERNAETRWLPWIIGVGLVVTLGLTWATRDEAKARAAAESAADRLRRSEEALRDSEARLRQVADAERQAHTEAAAANRAKDDFLATLSHELRTPLNAILGWASMLKSGRLNPQQQARALEVIARSARTQADLIEDLLDVSRIITGKLAIDLRPIGCAAPLRAALDAVRPTAEAKGIRLERRVDIDSPVLGDPDRLQQVAWNLLSNAIKFTPAGGTVAVSLERHDGQVELKVRDTGMGISPAFLPHVFERFKQYDSSTTRSHGGMGLGLAIVRHLVEAHGGSVRAESEGEGHGATFVVRLPVHAAGASLEATAAGGGGPLVSADAELSGLRALVVDDDEDARELMSSVLAAHGAEVKTAASAEEALQILDREAVDILLADIGMPGTDGYGLMRSVRSHPSERVRNLPAVAVTAYAGERDRDAALAAGFQAHVAKPIDLDSLHVIVRRLATTTN